MTTVTFTASAPDVTNPTFTWDFNDGETGTRGDKVDHVFKTKGTKTVRVTGRASDGSTASATTTVTVFDPVV